MTDDQHSDGSDAQLDSRIREAFLKSSGQDAADERQREIDALPSKTWKGRTVYGLRCYPGGGKQRHLVWVPERDCWSLADLQDYRCPYH